MSTGGGRARAGMGVARIVAGAGAMITATASVETSPSPPAPPGGGRLRLEESQSADSHHETDPSHDVQSSFQGALGAGVSGRANFIFAAFWAGSDVKASAVSVGLTCQSENS